ncbi:papilin-like [Octopus sinensis]|uniref:Papilin-like n=1 Tax=Octopus sinensis TaxID=2607531 RepID=A0A7E6ETK9_9MOLL|nr:papilin-like [Octopus sinensis]
MLRLIHWLFLICVGLGVRAGHHPDHHDIPSECTLPAELGSCTFPPSKRWYFDIKSETCKKFWYTCGGNSNNFLSREECIGVCTNVCSLPVVIGTGWGTMRRYYFNKKENRCKHFMCAGKGRNGNNFPSIEKCQNTCMSICKLPFDVAHVRALFRAFTTIINRRMQRFTYGGCLGNRNNFKTIQYCQKACGNFQNSPQCMSATDKSCSRLANKFFPLYFQIYYFNKKENRCKHFMCAGKGRNGNNFPSIEKCQNTCMSVCKLPFDVGPCEGAFPRFYYDYKSQECRRFTYGGCLGNRNNFKTIQYCQKACGNFQKYVRTQTSTKRIVLEHSHQSTCQVCTNVCSLPVVNGTGWETMRRYYFNKKENRCKHFMCAGKGRNGNNFPSIEKCQNTCMSVCKLPYDVGQCRGYFPRFYYDYKSQECRRFTYGGCLGNRNNFKTIQYCQKACGNFQS